MLFVSFPGVDGPPAEPWRGMARLGALATLPWAGGRHPSAWFQPRTSYWFCFCGVLFLGMLSIKEGVCFCFYFAKRCFFFFNMSVEFCRMLSLNLLKWTCCPLFLINVIETLNIKLLYIPGIIASGPYPS